MTCCARALYRRGDAPSLACGLNHGLLNELSSTNAAGPPALNANYRVETRNGGSHRSGGRIFSTDCCRRLSAYFSGYLVRRWQYREDHIAKRVDRLVEEIDSASGAAIDYWLLDPTDGELSSKERKAIEATVAKNGAHIVALQHRIAARDRLCSEISDLMMPRPWSNTNLHFLTLQQVAIWGSFESRRPLYAFPQSRAPRQAT